MSKKQICLALIAAALVSTTIAPAVALDFGGVPCGGQNQSPPPPPPPPPPPRPSRDPLTDGLLLLRYNAPAEQATTNGQNVTQGSQQVTPELPICGHCGADAHAQPTTPASRARH